MSSKYYNVKPIKLWFADEQFELISNYEKYVSAILKIVLFAKLLGNLTPSSE